MPSTPNYAQPKCERIFDALEIYKVFWQNRPLSELARAGIFLNKITIIKCDKANCDTVAPTASTDSAATPATNSNVDGNTIVIDGRRAVQHWLERRFKNATVPKSTDIQGDFTIAEHDGSTVVAKYKIGQGHLNKREMWQSKEIESTDTFVFTDRHEVELTCQISSSHWVGQEEEYGRFI